MDGNHELEMLRKCKIAKGDISRILYLCVGTFLCICMCSHVHAGRTCVFECWQMDGKQLAGICLGPASPPIDTTSSEMH